MFNRHEIAGIVKNVGANVQRFKVGDHVGVGTYVNSCRQCEYCEDCQEVSCTSGCTHTFNSIDVDGTVTKGGYSNYIVVHERLVLTSNLFSYIFDIKKSNLHYVKLNVHILSCTLQNSFLLYDP